MNQEAIDKAGAGPLISICIATYKRADELRESLARISRQTLGAEKIEVVISDDGSPDNTPEVVAQAQADYKMSIIYYRQANRGNVGYTQNRGIERATAPLLLLIPDDVWLEPDAVAHHVEAHQKQPEPEVAFLGQVLQAPELNQTAYLRNWDPFQFRSLKKNIELPYYMFWACHVSCKREFMLHHGMFRETLGRASHAANEDMETGYRLFKNGGLRIFYLSEARAYHYHVTTMEEELKRTYGRGINFHELREHVPHPEIAVRYHILTSYTLNDHIDALFGPRSRYLMDSERNVVKLLFQHLVRAIAFNGLTVDYFWMPVLKAAEHIPAIERLLNYQVYRGVNFYYYLKGVRRGYKDIVAGATSLASK